MTTKYETIPSHIIADGIESVIGKLQRRKTRLEVSTAWNFVDQNGRAITIHYRVIDLAISNQSDYSCDNYTIEAVFYKGRKVNLTSAGEQELLGILNIKNPASLKFN